MCYATKRKIADCVKNLMRHKDIRKITIQDIMDETKMSRQSFYYHFKDIYDVLEWVGHHDFEKLIDFREDESIEDWVIQLLDVIRGDRLFFEKMVREIEWPKILNCIREPIEAQIERIMSNCDISYTRLYADEMRFCVEFFTTSFCYYIMEDRKSVV